MAGKGSEGATSADGIVVGRVLSAWGSQGEVRVEALTDFPERFGVGGQVFIRGEPFSIRRSRWHKGCLLVKFHNVDTRDEAKALHGQYLEVPRGEAPPLPPDHYYHYQIIGLGVWTTGGDFLGEVSSVLSTGSNDVYVVHGPRGEVLIPAIEDVVKAVEPEAGRLIVEPIAGLFK